MGRSMKNKRKETDNGNECPFFDNCAIRLGHAEFANKVIALLHLFVRACYTTVGWFVLGKGITTAFFVSLFLFVVPVFMDCFQYGFVGWSKRWIVKIELFVCGLWLLFSSLGLTTIFIVTEDCFVTVASDFVGFQGKLLSAQWVWRLLGVLPFITWADFACRYTMTAELHHIKGKEK